MNSRLLLQVVTTLFSLCGVVYAEARRDTNDEDMRQVKDRLPVLAAGPGNKTPFVVRGLMPLPTDCYGFEVVWTGVRYRGAMLDLVDGTPLAISSDEQLMVINVADAYMFGAKPARFTKSVKANPSKPGALLVERGCHSHPDVNALHDATFDFQSPVVEAWENRVASTIEQRPDGVTVLTQDFEPGRRRVITFAAPPSRNFWVEQFSVAKNELTSRFQIILDGVDFSDDALRPVSFQDMAHKVDHFEVNARKVFEDGSFSRSNRAGAIRRASLGDVEQQKRLVEFGFDWARIAETNVPLIKAWTAALDTLGVKYSLPAKPPAN